MTIGILAIQIVTERPWPYGIRNKTAINAPLSQASVMLAGDHGRPQIPHKFAPEPKIMAQNQIFNPKGGMKLAPARGGMALDDTGGARTRWRDSRRLCAGWRSSTRGSSRRGAGSAAPELTTALEYDVEAALEEPDDY